MRHDTYNTDRSYMIRCMNMKACTYYISWYMYKKIMKPCLNKTREAKIQPRGSYTHQTCPYTKHKQGNQKEKPGKNTHHQGGGDQRGKEAPRP